MHSLVAAAMSLALAGAASADLPSVAGHWEGRLVEEGQDLPIRFDVARAATGEEVRFSVDRWAVMDYPLGPLARTGDHVTIHMGGTVLEGVLASDAIRGTFKGSDGEGTFELHRTGAPTLPYRTEAVSFRDGDVTLSGTLVLPQGAGRHPAVVLLHGSGPETRWGTSRYIADRLARAGIAALIYDKRGSGQSSGDWRKSSYEDLARDGIAGIDFLAARRDIDPRRIGLHGHSEGGIVASTAANLAPGRVAFVVAEDAPAMPIRDQDLYRVSRDIEAQSWSAEDKRKALDLFTLFVDAASGDRSFDDFAAAAGKVKDQPWFDYLGLPLDRNVWIWAWYRPRAHLDTGLAWKTVRRPTLLVYGERDQLMPVDQTLRRIEDGLDESGATYTALIAPRAEHNLTVHPGPKEPFFWWRQAPGVIDTVAAWVAKCTGPGGECREP